MKQKKHSYFIVKVLKNNFGKPQNVFLINDDNELMEFDTLEEAEKIAKIFENNSDSGWEYYVKKI